MPHRSLSLEEAARYLHLARQDVERLVRETDIPHDVLGGRIQFQRGALDAWASQRILGMPGKRLDVYHEQSMRGTRDALPGAALIPELLRAEYIDLGLPSKTRSSVMREMVGLAEKTGRVLDARELLKSVEEREAMCPTALPGGLALLHARNHAEYRFEGSFIVLGRTIQPIPFSAPDGRSTRIFFLVCCEDDRLHLHTLARLCMIALKSDAISQLFAAENRDAAYAALVEGENAVLPQPAEEPE